MATSAISFVVTNLTTLIQKEVGLLWGVDKEMRKLSSTLSTILAVLDDAELKQYREKSIQIWLRKLRDAAYKVRDILDDCDYQALRQEIKGQSSASMKKVWTSAITRYSVANLLFRYKIANRMKDIIEDINAIAEERMKFHLNEGFIGKGLPLTDDSRETSSALRPLEVFGRQDDKEKIIKVLTKDVCDLKEFSVYPVIGMGGLGKTTLAQMTFNDERMTSHFTLKIWVHVSQDFDVKRVMKQIIEFTSEKPCEGSSLDSLEKMLREMLSEKRYLLVLDDAWSEDQEEWDKLKHVLACGLPGACVVVTSRSEKVASIIGTLPTHHLSCLSQDDCWLLFRQRAFGPDKEEHPDLVDIGKEIVKKCGGIPLAAKALGGLLRFRREEKEWLNIKESELWDIPEGECSILPALRLSYYNLPLELRHCFSYCAVFPKGSQIEKDKLTHLWMANGFISATGKLQVEDVGNRICNELYMRSFFQSEENDRRGKSCFKMHDLMHDLARSVMEDERYMMEARCSSHILKERIEHTFFIGDSGSDCLSILFPNVMGKLWYLHAVRNPGRYPSISESEFYCDFKKFGSMRVFDANGARMMELSASVGNSKHLRYLNLSGTGIRELPASICSLYNLQTLNLNYCYMLQRLPKNMKRLRGLRHLYLLHCDRIEDTPPKIGRLTQLKTLSLFVVGESSGQRLGQLQHLDLGGEVEIKHLERVRNSTEANEANLAGKHNLRIVRMSWEKLSVFVSSSEENIVRQQVIESLKPHPNVQALTVSYYAGKELPIWMGNASLLKNVIRIELSGCRNCSWISALAQLPCLKLLQVVGVMENLEYMIQNAGFSQGVTSVGEFPSLEELHIEKLPNLKGFSKEEDEGREQQILPRLRKMVVSSCPKLTFPTLPALQALTIYHGSNVTLTSILKLTSLTGLVLFQNENMTSLPDEMLQNLTLLQTLNINGYRKLKVLPKSMSSLVSLKELCLTKCEKLECLPDSIRSLTQLQTLALWDLSPYLHLRCREGGQDWRKIAHIPRVHTNYR